MKWIQNVNLPATEGGAAVAVFLPAFVVVGYFAAGANHEVFSWFNGGLAVRNTDISVPPCHFFTYLILQTCVNQTMLRSNFSGAVSGSTLHYPVRLNNCYLYLFYKIYAQVIPTNTPTNYSTPTSTFCLSLG